MDVVAAFASDAEATELMEPTDRAFDDPTIDSQSTAMRCPAFGKDWPNSSPSQLPTMRLRVVGAVSLNAIRPSTRPAPLSLHGWNGVDQRHQLSHIMPIGTGQRCGQRNAIGVRDQVMLAAGFTAIRWIGSRFFPPCIARTDEESTIARDQSMRSASARWFNRTSWTFCQTPACCQAYSRRQAVIPDPQPSSCGKYSQGRPVFSTNKIAQSALRLSMGFRPGYRLRRFLGDGSNGPISSHNLSSKTGFAMTAPPCAATTLA